MSDFNFSKDAKWKGLLKVLEEGNELGVELNKLQMVDGDLDGYWGGRDLKTNIENELGDQLAATSAFIELNRHQLDIGRITDRQIEKYFEYMKWGTEGDNPVGTV